MPATSSITIAPGSLLPIARSACSAAHVPTAGTMMKKATRPVRENGMGQRARVVSALATVPGANGTRPTPPTVAMATARRVAAVLLVLGNELVAFDLDDARAREA